MKRIKTFLTSRTRLSKNQTRANLAKRVKVISGISILALVIWFVSPYIHWGEVTPFHAFEKRFYLLAFIFVLWIFILLMCGSKQHNEQKKYHALLRIKARELQQRFLGAWQFLKKTSVTKYGKSVRLAQLPWLLFVGPSRSGKTSLLANSNINFVLHKQFQLQSTQPMAASEHCNWWLTRDVNILDVPSQFLLPTSKNKQNKLSDVALLWDTLLQLIKKYRGKHAIAGIAIALPLPEILLQKDHKKYYLQLHYLFDRLQMLQSLFQDKIPYQLIITKCDLLPGFKEFFMNATEDEVIQPWGVQLADANPQTFVNVINEQFDAMIKKLNQQLLWRLHQEHDSSLRPLIKDFPLQMERLKNLVLDFFKKLYATHLNFRVHALYLTSARQAQLDDGYQADVGESSAYALQVCKPIAMPSRAYFIKQVITHAIMHGLSQRKKPVIFTSWRRKFAYAAAILVIGTATYILGYDFERGIKHSYAIQSEVSDYQLAIEPVHNIDEHLVKTVELLNTLAASAKKTSFKFDLATLTNFYSRRSTHHAVAVYHQALQTVFVPEMKNYFAAYLQAPINKNPENVYAALGAYLMLGHPERAEMDWISQIFYQILPPSAKADIQQQMARHFHALARVGWKAQPLDEKIIRDTQHYFTAMPGLRLATIILNNHGTNMHASEVNSLLQNAHEVFMAPSAVKIVPNMFTAKSFGRILSHDTLQAAQDTIAGNWILGGMMQSHLSVEQINALTEQLRNAYINRYIDTWENILSGIQLTKIDNLQQVNQLLGQLTSNNSSLLEVIRIVHENTYFEPIISASPKLQNVGVLLDKAKQSDTLLYQILATLQLFQQQIQAIVNADDPKKAAFTFMAHHAKQGATPDALLQLRIVAAKSPDPVKHWLEKIADDAWRYLTQSASHYLDTAWREQVVAPYRKDIAKHFPFDLASQQDVELTKFTAFFGSPGIVNDFYKNYLQAFVDTSKPVWAWKAIDNLPLPFSDDALHGIQQAMRIHQIFFPNGDNQMYLRFTLQPYRFDKNIKSIQLKINGKLFSDLHADNKTQHTLTWPGEHPGSATSVQIQLANNKMLNYKYPGVWGWFKLINDGLESSLGKKQMIVNLTKTADTAPAKYYYFADGQYNPFSVAHLQQFNLPDQLG